MKNNIKSGIMGLTVADALGVPVEFVDRQTLRQNPVVGMREYGTFNQPAGTWSDDTSMTLGLVDSLSTGLDYNDMMVNFTKWFKAGEYTPFDHAFGIGITTRQSLLNFESGITPLECGGITEYDNGNGSLMRILPILFYLESIYGKQFIANNENMDIIHNISALTHGHKRSQIACGIYISVASRLLLNTNLDSAVNRGIQEAMKYYENQPEFIEELAHFERLEEEDFAEIPSDEIKSGGYVVHTLEAAIWCLLQTDSYENCVLKAVNLGEDTDTVAAVAGGLAGLYYGYEAIPEEWLNTIVRRDYIEDLCDQFHLAMVRKSVEKLNFYIPYFERATEKSEVQWTDAFPTYSDTLIEFIDEVHKTNLITTGYLNIINDQNFDSNEKMTSIIEHVNLEVLRAILTSYIRQERFCDGIWAEAVEDKIFLGILNRLNQLT